MTIKPEKPLSNSHKIHNWINKHWNDGLQFTAKYLLNKINVDISTITEGQVSGFLHRATKVGMLHVFKKVKEENKRPYYVFILTDKSKGWNFTYGSIGSQKGRVLNEHNALYNGETIKVLTEPVKENHPMDEAAKSLADHERKKREKQDTLSSWARSCVEAGTAHSELELRLQEARYLQRALAASEQPHIKDISTDVLIEELKKRIK